MKLYGLQMTGLIKNNSEVSGPFQVVKLIFMNQAQKIRVKQLINLNGDYLDLMKIQIKLKKHLSDYLKNGYRNMIK